MAAADQPDDEVPPRGSQRVDKWLWFARIARSRTLAAQLVADGKVRVNRVKALKPSQAIHPGDVLTIAVRGRIDILRVEAPGERRGSAAAAQRLYSVLTPAGTGNLRPRAPDETKDGKAD